MGVVGSFKIYLFLIKAKLLLRLVAIKEYRYSHPTPLTDQQPSASGSGIYLSTRHI